MPIVGTRVEFETRVKALRAKISSLEADFENAGRRLVELDEELRQAQTRREVVANSRARMDEQIIAAREELEQIKALAPAAVREPQPAKPLERQVNEGQVRAAILKFRWFTLADLAAYLRVPAKRAGELLSGEEAKGIVRATGETQNRSPVYEYVAPDDEGAAFRVQQEMRERQADDPVYAVEVGGVGDGYLQALPKDVRKEARLAMRDGWVLMPNGSGHYSLHRDGVTITVSSTPQNASAEARVLRRRLGAAVTVRRGAPVPHTGRPVGSSGKPGLDKARADAGIRVRRKGRKGM